jgi:hypothetical protein
LLVFGYRPHFDRADACAWYSGGDLDRLAPVCRFDHVVAAELLLGLRIRPISSRSFPVSDAHDGRRIGHEQPIASDEMTALPDLFGEDAVFVVVFRGFGRRHLFHHGFGTNQT